MYCFHQILKKMLHHKRKKLLAPKWTSDQDRFFREVLAEIATWIDYEGNYVVRLTKLPGKIPAKDRGTCSGRLVTHKQNGLARRVE